MANITIKGIRESTYEALKRTAARNHRSINGEIIHLIEQNLGTSAGFNLVVKETAKKYRGKAKDTPLDPEILRRQKKEGRE